MRESSDDGSDAKDIDNDDLKQSNLNDKDGKQQLGENISKYYQHHQIKEHSYLINELSKIGTLTEVFDEDTGITKTKIFARTDFETCMRGLRSIRREINLDMQKQDKETILALGDLHSLTDMFIPLARDYGTIDNEINNKNLLLEITKIAVQLTMPIEEGERLSHKRLQHMLEYKEAFLEPNVLAIFVSLLDKPLSVESEKRAKDDNLVVELVLWLLRNLLAVPDAKNSSTSTVKAHYSHLHEDFVLMLQEEHLIDTLLHLAEFVGKKGNREWNLILLELFFNLFRGSRPEELLFDDDEDIREDDEKENGLDVNRKRASKTDNLDFNIDDIINDSNIQKPAKKAKVQPKKAIDHLDAILEEEMEQSRKNKSHLSSRHSRFGSAFVLQTEAGRRKIISDASEVVNSISTTPSKLSGLNENDIKSRASVQQSRKAKKDPSVIPSSIILDEGSAVRSKRLRRVLRKCCERFVAKCYRPLFEALKQDFRREDARLLPADQLQYLWLSWYCMRFQRLSIAHADADFLKKLKYNRETEDYQTLDEILSEIELKESSMPSYVFDWYSSGLVVTMDIWSFHFVIKSTHMFRESKSYVSLETSTATLLEMFSIILAMRHSKVEACQKIASSLQNAVFYELGELDIVSQMLRAWEPAIFTWNHLRTLGSLMHVILSIAEQMAEEGAVVKKNHRSASSAKKKKNKVYAWSSEETHALVEGVKQYGDTPSGFRAILRDPYFSTIFDGQFRNLKQLASRWDKVNAAIKSGIPLSQFLAEEVQEEADDLDDANDNDENKEQSGNEVNGERELDYEQILRSFLSFQVMYNLFVMVDPAAPPPSSAFRDLTSKESHYHYIVAYHIQRLRTFSKGLNERESLEPMLWNLGLFLKYERILTVLRNEIKKESKHRRETNDDDGLLLPSYMISLPGGRNFCGTRYLVLILESVVRHFIKHAKQNPLIYAEILFAQQKQDTIAISVFYEDEFTLRQRKLMEIEEQRKQYYDALDKEQGLVDGNAATSEPSRYLAPKENNNDKDDIGEEEAVFEDYQAPEPELAVEKEDEDEGIGRATKSGNEKKRRTLVLDDEEEMS